MGFNMFAYCNNDPILFSDCTGTVSALAEPTATYFEDTLSGGGGGGGGAVVVVGVAATVVVCKAIFTTVIDAANYLWNRISKSYAAAKSRTYKSPEEVHHLVAKEARNAAFAAEILNQVLPGGVENPINKISIKTGLHRRLHNKIYYYIVNSLVITAYTSSTNPTEQQANVVLVLGLLRGIVAYLNAKAPY